MPSAQPWLVVATVTSPVNAVPKLPLSAESQAYWAAAGAARDPRDGLLHAAGGDGGGFGFGGTPNSGGDWTLFKHNSCEDVEMAVDEAMQVTGRPSASVLHLQNVVAGAHTPWRVVSWFLQSHKHTNNILCHGSALLRCAALPAASPPIFTLM